MTEPLSLSVPLGDCSEVALMGALEFVISHFRGSAVQPLTFAEVQRAVDWLSAKYGTEAASE